MQTMSPRAMISAGLAVAALALIAARPQPRAVVSAVPCDADNAGLTLPAGFCATRFDSVQAPRHMVVAPNGDVLVVGNAMGGRGAPVPRPGGVYLLRDANQDGHADTIIRLADANGSGVALANGYLYTSFGTSVVRYAYETGATSVGAPDTIISGFDRGGHTAYNFVVVGPTLYMNVGSPSNSCQVNDRRKGSMGKDPCAEIELRAGIWTFDANKSGQNAHEGVRYAAGIRNSVALAVDPRDQSLWVTMHGRDGLQDSTSTGQWFFSDAYGAENPGEQVNHVKRGDDFGWPYCYWSIEEKKLVTAPEYGGDGKRSDRCADKKNPVYAFPGHWGPNDMMFYTGSQFPPQYKNGAFVAFHGSWNRAPLPNEGYRVAFLPLAGERASQHEDFATGFATPNGGPGGDGRPHRPTGLAQGTDGSIYVSDDRSGTIYKISYRGGR